MSWLKPLSEPIASEKTVAPGAVLSTLSCHLWLSAWGATDQGSGTGWVWPAPWKCDVSGGQAETEGSAQLLSQIQTRKNLASVIWAIEVISIFSNWTAFKCVSSNNYLFTEYSSVISSCHIVPF